MNEDALQQAIANPQNLGEMKDADAVGTVTANAAKAVPGAKIEGVLVSEMAQGIEALIGVINDESFGPVVALGLGGVLTEVLKDVTYRIAPFDIETAREMIADLRGAKLFDGYRGKSAGSGSRQGREGQESLHRHAGAVAGSERY